MKKINTFYLPASFLLFIAVNSSAQVFDSILAMYGREYQQERAYLHYDKVIYHPGETVWFKAYLVNSGNATESSHTFYVDWVDEKGTLLHHTSSPVLAGGITHGQFDIPENYTANFVHVRAYTKWMLNFDTAFLYQKNIRILQKGKGTIPLPAIQPSLQLFPEGGDMIMGLRNKIAFKASDQWGRPVNISGVVEKNGSPLDSLKVIHGGMGFFYIIPGENDKYTVRWQDENKKEYITDLPPAKPEGVSLQVSFTAGRRVFTVERTPGVPEHQKRLHLIGTMRETLILKANIDLRNNPVYNGAFPVQTLPTGVLTITVFDEQWNALAERVVHINNNDYFFSVKPEIQKLGWSKRGRNEIELTVPDSLEANLSIAVTDGSIESNNDDHIIPYFLLSAELRGTIYKPSYYFKNNSDSLAKKLDLVMLTHGWRRFKWEDLAKGKLPTIRYPKETAYLTLSGKITGATPQQLQAAGAMMMVAKQKQDATQTVLASIEKDGSFRNAQYIFFDSLTVYYQLPKALTKASVDFMTLRWKSRSYKNFIANISPDTTGYYRQEQLLNATEDLNRLAKEKTLANVTVTARTKTRMELIDEKYSRGLFAGSDARQFNLMDDPVSTTYNDALNYLQGKVGGLQISSSPANPDSPYTILWRGGSPLLYLDESPTTVPALAALPAQNIAYIKIFRPIFMAYGGEYGAISFYTRRGDDYANRDATNLPHQTVMGYSPVREFFSPDYATATGEEIPDTRITLLWKPQIATGKNENKISLVFYNTDVFSKSLRITVEGMSRDGRMTHYEQVIK